MRGHVLFLTVTLIAVGTVSFTLMATRLSLATAARDTSDVRAQALWLGRSAITAGVTGTKDLATAEGKASVHLAKKDGKAIATVTLPRGVAVVSSSPGGWEEQYEPR